MSTFLRLLCLPIQVIFKHFIHQYVCRLKKYKLRNKKKSICLNLYLCIHLSIYLSICRCSNLSIYYATNQSTFLYLNSYMYIYVYLSIYPSVYIFQPVYSFSILSLISFLSDLIVSRRSSELCFRSFLHFRCTFISYSLLLSLSLIGATRGEG